MHSNIVVQRNNKDHNNRILCFKYIFQGFGFLWGLHLPEIFSQTQEFQEIKEEAGKVAEKKDDHNANQYRGKRHLALHVLVPITYKCERFQLCDSDSKLWEG